MALVNYSNTKQWQVRRVYDPPTIGIMCTSVLLIEFSGSDLQQSNVCTLKTTRITWYPKSNLISPKYEVIFASWLEIMESIGKPSFSSVLESIVHLPWKAILKLNLKWQNPNTWHCATLFKTLSYISELRITTYIIDKDDEPAGGELQYLNSVFPLHTLQYLPKPLNIKV